EEHGQPIYCVSFNFYREGCQNVFASCGSNGATIYRCLEGGAVEILQAYIDEDVQEEFFACKWSVDPDTGDPLLLIAGKKGLLKILNCATQKLEWAAEGHGDAINDISIHPMRPSLVLTASRDSSLRLWNTKTKVCVLIMNGDGGHRNEVLSIDFNPVDGNQFVSCGMDNTVKIWNLEGRRMLKHVEKSFDYTGEDGIAFDTKFLACPKAHVVQVHYNYVDCVRFIGDLILSKSVDERIYLWRPDISLDEPVDVKGHIHYELELEDCAHVWFVRFALDRQCRTLACGTTTGMVLVWDPHTLSPRPKARLKRTPGSKTTVRQTAISADGDIIVSCCDDGTIWRFDLVPKESLSAAAKSKQANGVSKK
ncbi:fertilization-independent endosperm protein 2, partial [Coccomyxa subellipsoidea C-169]